MNLVCHTAASIRTRRGNSDTWAGHFAVAFFTHMVPHGLPLTPIQQRIVDCVLAAPTNARLAFITVPPVAPAFADASVDFDTAFHVACLSRRPVDPCIAFVSLTQRDCIRRCRHFMATFVKPVKTMVVQHACLDLRGGDPYIQWSDNSNSNNNNNKNETRVIHYNCFRDMVPMICGNDSRNIRGWTRMPSFWIWANVAIMPASIALGRWIDQPDDTRSLPGLHIMTGCFHEVPPIEAWLGWELAGWTVIDLNDARPSAILPVPSPIPGN